MTKNKTIYRGLVFIYALFIFSGLLLPGTVTSQNNPVAFQIDSMKKRLINTRHDSERVAIFFSIGESQINLKTDSARHYFSLALDLARKNLEHKRKISEKERIFFKKTIGEALADIAVTYDGDGNENLALEYYTKSLEELKAVDDKPAMATIYNNMAVMLGGLGNVRDQLNYLQKSITLYVQLKDSIGISRTYNNLGMAYHTQNDTAKASEFILKALEIRERIGDKRGLSVSLHNAGQFFSEIGQTEKAINYYKRGIELCTQIGYKKGLAYSVNNLGYLYLQLHDTIQGMELLEKSLGIRKEINDQRGIAYSYENIASLYQRTGKNQQAKVYADSAFKLSLKLGSPELISKAAILLHQIYADSHNWKQAFDMYKLHIKMRDSLFNEENTKKTVQMQMKYDFDKRAAADSVRNQESKKLEVIKHNAAIGRQRTYTYAGIGGFAIMLVVAGISYRAFKNKKKANEEIARQKEMVEMKQKEILDSIQYAKRIQRSLLTPEKYISRILKKLNA